MRSVPFHMHPITMVVCCSQIISSSNPRHNASRKDTLRLSSATKFFSMTKYHTLWLNDDQDTFFSFFIDTFTTYVSYNLRWYILSRYLRRYEVSNGRYRLEITMVICTRYFSFFRSNCGRILYGHKWKENIPLL